MSDGSSVSKMSRKFPPVFPTGFRFGTVSEESLIVDFIDVSNDEGTGSIFQSIALNRTTAEQLYTGLKRFVKDED